MGHKLEQSFCDRQNIKHAQPHTADEENQQVIQTKNE